MLTVFWNKEIGYGLNLVCLLAFTVNINLLVKVSLKIL
jgi:hypothetical protein